MGTFAVGDVVTVIFPFTDLSAFKKRPALIVGVAEFGNYITCQITSRAMTSKKAIVLSDHDFVDGKLRVDSYIRPDKIFTLGPTIIHSKVGTLSESKVAEVKATLRRIFK